MISLIALSFQQCNILWRTAAVESYSGNPTYNLLLTLAYPSTKICAWTCTLTAGGNSVSGVLISNSNVSLNNYSYLRFSGLTPYTSYTGSCTGQRRRRMKAFKFLERTKSKGKQGSGGSFTWVFPRNTAFTRILAFGDWAASANISVVNGTQSVANGVNGWNTLNFLQANRSNYYDAFIFAGDLAYNLYNQEYFTSGQNYYADGGVTGNNWMSNIANFLSYQPFAFVAGNHEAMQYNSTTKPMVTTYNDTRNRFYNPNYTLSQNDWYSFDVNNVHIVGINSEAFWTIWEILPNSTARQQAIQNFITTDAATRSPSTVWRILYMHQNFYCSYGSTSDNRCGSGADSFRAALESYVKGNFDLVVQGHVHWYERTVPAFNAVGNMTGMSNNNATWTNPSNPIYVVCGAPGNAEQGTTVPAFTPNSTTVLVNYKQQGIGEITATATTLNFTYTSTTPGSQGTVLDTFVIIK